MGLEPGFLTSHTRPLGCMRYHWGVNSLTNSVLLRIWWESNDLNQLPELLKILLKDWNILFFPCCSSVATSWSLCNPVNCRTPGFPSLHYFPEFAQTHGHYPTIVHCMQSVTIPRSFWMVWKSEKLRIKTAIATAKLSLLFPHDEDYAAWEKGVFFSGEAICDASSHKSWTSGTRLYSPSVRFWTVGQLCHWPNLINVHVTWVRHPAASQMN